LNTLLEAAARLAHRPDIAFCFVGGGSEFKTVQAFAKDRQLQNIKTIPYQPVTALSASLSSADLHVVVMGEPFVGIVHPCKVYNIRALGIPYLYVGPTDSHITDLDPTFVAAHGDVSAVVRHIECASTWGAMRTSASVDAHLHSHDRLVTRMALMLEASATHTPLTQPVREASL
jgi:hypothetical protein